MSYDITFCEGESCPRKEDCHRFRELLRFRADKDPNKKTYISMTKPNDPDHIIVVHSTPHGIDTWSSLRDVKKGGLEGILRTLKNQKI